MRTVKEISQITGISVRTLHYYDEIGLLKPTAKSEAGYRLYDDKALEILRQILFFREFDISLRKIKALLESPDLDEKKILQMQRKMLKAKRDRIDRMISGIDDILKGEKKMDFAVFTKTEIENMYQSMVENMTEEQKDVFIKNYGSMDEFRRHFLETAGSEAAQENFRKVVEWYGGKEKALEASKNPGNPELFPAWQKRLEAVMEKLAAKKGCGVYSFEVKEVVGEYDFVCKQLWQMDDVTQMMKETAELYMTNSQVQASMDSIYGEGATEFFGRAIQAFYERE